MMQQRLSAYGAEVLHERVHTVEDVRRFLRKEGRDAATRFIHIMGHGSDDSGVGKATLYLTFERLKLGEQPAIFEGLEGKVIIFSCCEVGADRKVLEKIKKASGAAGVIAYRTVVSDWYTTWPRRCCTRNSSTARRSLPPPRFGRSARRSAFSASASMTRSPGSLCSYAFEAECSARPKNP
ncbi:MAG: hypothetical protein NTW86_14170 [Candidatus Sumerlaeota bacterium]|nr:hypothetical protein [Candidatus Sumerlaeota bacterium]